MRILLLTLDTFSKAGGIQQFNRSLQMALAESGHAVTHWSVYDRQSDFHDKYSAGHSVTFEAFAQDKKGFFRAWVGVFGKFDLIIFGHVNLSPLAIFPGLNRTTCWMVAHGVEVWQQPGFLKRLGMRRMNRILSVSHFTQKKLMERSGIPAEKIDYFPNCLDPFFAIAPVQDAREWNHAWRLDTQLPYLFTLARLTQTEQAKGYEQVIRSLPALIKEVPDLHYLLGGKWDKPTYTKIRQLADDLGVGERVLMSGYVPAASLPAIYNLARVFVMPSSKEGFGIVYLEAAWFGCRVVGSDAGGAPEALMQGALGEMVSPGDPEALQAAILSALKAGPVGSDMLQQRREKIDTAFGYAAMKERLLRLLPS